MTKVKLSAPDELDGLMVRTARARRVRAMAWASVPMRHHIFCEDSTPMVVIGRFLAGFPGHEAPQASPGAPGVSLRGPRYLRIAMRRTAPPSQSF